LDALKGAQETAEALSADIEEGRRRERSLEVRTMLLSAHHTSALTRAVCSRWSPQSIPGSKVACRSALEQQSPEGYDTTCSNLCYIGCTGRCILLDRLQASIRAAAEERQQQWRQVVGECERQIASLEARRLLEHPCPGPVCRFRQDHQAMCKMTSSIAPMWQAAALAQCLLRQARFTSLKWAMLHLIRKRTDGQ